MATTKVEFEDYCLNILGGILDDDGMSLTFECPPGRVVHGLDVHMLTVTYANGRFTKPEARAHLLEDLDNGLDPCPHIECGNPCDYCDESE